MDPADRPLEAIPPRVALIQLGVVGAVVAGLVLLSRQARVVEWFGLVPPSVGLVVGVLLQGIPALLTLALLLRRFHQRWASIGLSRTRPWPEVRAGFKALLGTYLLQVALVSLYLAVTRPQLEAVAGDRWGWMGQLASVPPLAILPLALFVGVYEELVFRGFLLSRLLSALEPLRLSPSVRATAAILSSSILFALGHGYQGTLGTLQTLAAGTVLAFVTWRRQSVWAAITAHACIDLFGLLALQALKPMMEKMT